MGRSLFQQNYTTKRRTFVPWIYKQFQQREERSLFEDETAIVVIVRYCQGNEKSREDQEKGLVIHLRLILPKQRGNRGVHARRTASASASASVVVRRSASSLHLYIYISIYEAFPRPRQILYIFLAEQSRIIAPLVQTRARARLVGTWTCYVLQPRRANGFQGIFFIRYSIHSLFFFLLFFSVS